MPQIDRTKQLSFDGFGVNGWDTDGYGARIAKLQLYANSWNADPPYNVRNSDFDYYGRLFEKSPEMLNWLKDFSQMAESNNQPVLSDKIDELIKYIETGEK